MMTSCAAVCAKCPIIHARDFGAIRIGTAFVSACGVAASGKIPVGTVEAMQTIIISFFRYEETHCTHCVGGWSRYIFVKVQLQFFGWQRPISILWRFQNNCVFSCLWWKSQYCADEMSRTSAEPLISKLIFREKPDWTQLKSLPSFLM